MSYKPPMGDPVFLQRPIGGANGGGANRRSASSSRSEAKVYTGSSAPMKDLVNKSEPSIKKQVGELFHRVRPTTIGAMLDRQRVSDLQYHEAELLAEGGMAHRPEPLPGHEDLVGRRTAQVSSYNKTISETIRPTSSVIGGGASSMATPARGGGGRGGGGGRVDDTNSNAYGIGGGGGGDPQQVPFIDREILILDVREKEEYDVCHIQGALSYPPLRLAHATNPYSLKEIRDFKNKPNHAIVLYDLDEEVTVQRKMANIFFEKGADNVYIIAGGLTAFVQTHAHLITGPSPVAVVAKSARLSAYGQDKMASTQRGSSVGRGGGSEIAYGRRSGSSTRTGATTQSSTSRLKGAFNRAAQPGPSTAGRAGAPPRPPQPGAPIHHNTRAPPPPQSSSGYSTTTSQHQRNVNDGNYGNCQGGRVPTPQRVQRIMQMAMTEDELSNSPNSSHRGHHQHHPSTANQGGYDDDYEGGGYEEDGGLDHTTSYDDHPSSQHQQQPHQYQQQPPNDGGGYQQYDFSNYDPNNTNGSGRRYVDY